LLKDLKITEFLAKTASGTAIPGGGCVAALNGALAAGLTAMVANLTIAKKGYESTAAEMKAIARTASDLKDKLAEDIDNDADAYRKVMAALKFPKDTEEEKRWRAQAVQDAFKKAALVPLGVARDAVKIMDLAGRVIEKGYKNAVTDGAVAAMTARTAALAALYNVEINLGSIEDKAFVEEVTREVKRLEGEVQQKEAEILSQVEI
jgi:formiminotetrahydrofolate cyclodeaminase